MRLAAVGLSQACGCKGGGDDSNNRTSDPTPLPCAWLSIGLGRRVEADDGGGRSGASLQRRVRASHCVRFRVSINS